MRGYELYVGASGITAGPEVKDIFFTLTDTGTTYVQAQDKLTNTSPLVKTLRTTVTYLGRSLKSKGKLWRNT